MIASRMHTIFKLKHWMGYRMGKLNMLNHSKHTVLLVKLCTVKSSVKLLSHKNIFKSELEGVCKPSISTHSNSITMLLHLKTQ